MAKLLASGQKRSLRDRLDALLFDAGVLAGGDGIGSLLGDARRLASAIGLEFVTVVALLDESEALLYGCRAPANGSSTAAACGTFKRPASMASTLLASTAASSATISAAHLPAPSEDGREVGMDSKRARLTGKRAVIAAVPVPAVLAVPTAVAVPAVAPVVVSAALWPLPFNCLSSIAKFSGNPPSIYCLCMTSAALHSRTAQDEPVVATRLLRDALMSSLLRVLTYHKIPFPAVSFGSMRSVDGTPGAVLSGSTMVQVVLGEVWKDSDVDIFCTASASPAVRTQLVQNGFSLARMHDNYEDSGNGMTAFLLETMVHHVEGWADTPKENDRNCETDSLDSDDTEFDFARSCRHGKGASKHFYRNLSEYIPVKVPRTADQEIQTLPNTPLSYDYNLKDRLDLVIGKSGCKDARGLLQSFDILLCAASYDGVVFHTPHPHLAFCRKSKLEPARLVMMKTFANVWKKEKANFFRGRPDLDSLVAAPWFKSVETAMKNAGVKVGKKVTQTTPMEDMLGRYYWNFLARLFQRHKKYAARNIELVDAPAGFKTIAREVHVDNIPQADIGVFGHHLDTHGVTYLSTNVLPGTKDVAQLIRQVGGNLGAMFKSSECSVMGAAQCIKLIRYLDEQYAASRINKTEGADFKCTITRTALAAMIGYECMGNLCDLFPGDFNEIKMRRCDAHGKCVNFHTDVSLRTLQVPLNSDDEYEGGRLVYATSKGLKMPSRPMGSYTLHDASIVHGVTPLSMGIRYGLFLLATHS